MEFEDQISEILSQYDVTTDLGRKKAFNASEMYANEKLNDSVDYNYFMSLVAKRLQMDPIIKNVLRLIRSEGTEKVILKYVEGSGPCLSANQQGLLYLSHAFGVLATSKLPGDHFHLRYQEFPMVGRSFPLTVYLDDDTFFETEVKEEAKEQPAPPKIPMREVNPQDIAALVITDKIPDSLLLTPGHIYPVRRTEAFNKQKAWAKSIREKTDRMFLFEFTNDDGAVTELVLDLDDPGVVFIPRSGLKQVCPNQRSNRTLDSAG